MTLFDKGPAAGAGQSIPASEYADDDGSADADVLAALRAFPDAVLAGYSPGGAAVVAALAGSRLLVPLIAEVDSTYEVPLARTPDQGAADGGSPGESATGGPAVTVEKDSHVSTVSLRSANGQTGMVALTGVEQLREWRGELAVIPTQAALVAAAAISDGADALLLDPGSAHRLAISGPALWALAERREFVSPVDDPAILAIAEDCVAAALRSELLDRRTGTRIIDGVRLLPPNTPDSDVEIHLLVDPSATQSDVQETLRRCSAELGRSLELRKRLVRGISLGGSATPRT